MRPAGETEFVNGVAAMSASGLYGKTRVCAGIVGHANLMLGSRVEPVLAALMRAGGDRFRGIRHITAWDPAMSTNPNYPATAGMLSDRTFRDGFAALGRLGLSFDAWLYHPQIDDVGSLAAAFPNTKIVLNHVGGPLGVGSYAGKRNEVFSAWAASIKRLAAHQNVYVKVGGLGQGLSGFGLNERPEPPSSDIVAATFARTSRLASRLSAPRARCSRATSRSTKSPTVIRSSGMPASSWRRAPALPRKQICSPERRRGFIVSTQSCKLFNCSKA